MKTLSLSYIDLNGFGDYIELRCTRMYYHSFITHIVILIIFFSRIHGMLIVKGNKVYEVSVLVIMLYASDRFRYKIRNETDFCHFVPTQQLTYFDSQ